MNQIWYIKFLWWLCEKTGHLWIDHAWIYGGFYHRNCKLCKRIVSEPLKEFKK